MISSDATRTEKLCVQFLENASMLIAIQDVYGKEAKKETKKAYGCLLSAHMLICGVLHSMLMRTHGKIVVIQTYSHEIDALMANFVLGLSLCEASINEGRYVQAMALLRQEMEIIAQIKNTKHGKRKNKGSPNVGCLELSIRRLYSELSNVAHVADHAMIYDAVRFDVQGADLPGPTNGTRYFPSPNTSIARRAFTLHLLLMVGLVEELAACLEEQHGDGPTIDEKDAINEAVQLMRSEGLLAVGETD